jgi:hypothetical protein
VWYSAASSQLSKQNSRHRHRTLEEHYQPLPGSYFTEGEGKQETHHRHPRGAGILLMCCQIRRKNVLFILSHGAHNMSTFREVMNDAYHRSKLNICWIKQRDELSSYHCSYGCDTFLCLCNSNKITYCRKKANEKKFSSSHIHSYFCLKSFLVKYLPLNLHTLEHRALIHPIPLLCIGPSSTGPKRTDPSSFLVTSPKSETTEKIYFAELCNKVLGLKNYDIFSGKNAFLFVNFHIC